MRVVIAPFNRMQPSTLEAVRAAGHEVICTGREAASYADIVGQLPAGWKPDVFLFWSLEYNPAPDGIEDADCFTVGVVGDWNLGGQAVQQAGGAFDLLIADANGCDRLRSLGFENVRTAPLWSYDPGLHRRLPNVRRDLDIVMIGNFNHDIQRERAKWLARVARLSSRWRVCLTSGVQGEAYTQLMNRAKIVFNRSIRGEINMRAYEAPACGALHFYESENREIRNLYADRKEVVLYDDDNLEDLLAYYLTHEKEREQIARAGWQRVQSETPSEHLLRLLEIIHIASVSLSSLPKKEPEIESRHGRSARTCGAEGPFTGLPGARPLLERRTAHESRVRQWLLTSDRSFLPEVERALLRAELSGTNPATVAKLRGNMLALAGENLPDAARQDFWRQAAEQWRLALSLEPASAVTHLNLAHMMLETGSTAAAEQSALQAYELLKDRSRVPFVPGDLHWPRCYGAFEVELEHIEGGYRQGTEEWSSAVRGLLVWRACELLADLAFNSHQFGLAADFAREAVMQQSEIGATQYRLARAVRALGQVEEAVDAYHRALEAAPFLVEARYELTALLIDIARPAEALPILEDWRRIIAGCPVYRSFIPECERLLSLARRCEPAQTAQMSQVPRRLLAFPDWQRPDHWQGIVRAFVERGDPTPALLLLWADPVRFPHTACLLREIEAYLTVVLRISRSALPEITLMAQPLPPEDRWKLFHIADAVMSPCEPPAEFMEPFRASRLSR